MLPDQDFFTPTPAFGEWVKNQAWLRYRRIIDAGAGRGLLTLVLRELGLETVGIDLHERPVNLGNVQIADATTYDYDADDVLMIARPCHGGWHQQAIERAHRYGCLDTLYIGLERNLEQDFDDEWELELLLENAGADGECVWRVYGRKVKLKSYSQHKNGSWGRLEQATNPRTGEHEWRFRNDNGGYCIVDPATDIIDARYKEYSWQGSYVDPSVYAGNSERAALHRHAGSSRKDKGGYGWVGPDGAWYPCGSADHARMLADAFGISRQRCERLGFVKCYGDFYAREFPFSWTAAKQDEAARRPNAAQLKTLAKIGFDVSDEQNLEERGVETLSEEEQREFQRVMAKPRVKRDPKTGYRTDRSGD